MLQILGKRFERLKGEYSHKLWVMLQLGSDIKFNGLSFRHCVFIVLDTHVTASQPGQGWFSPLLDGISMQNCGALFKWFANVYCVTFSSPTQESAQKPTLVVWVTETDNGVHINGGLRDLFTFYFLITLNGETEEKTTVLNSKADLFVWGVFTGPLNCFLGDFHPAKCRKTQSQSQPKGSQCHWHHRVFLPDRAHLGQLLPQEREGKKKGWSGDKAPGVRCAELGWLPLFPAMAMAIWSHAQKQRAGFSPAVTQPKQGAKPGKPCCSQQPMASSACI